MAGQQLVCDECGIRHDSALPVCPWCGYAREDGVVTPVESRDTPPGSEPTSPPELDDHPAHNFARAAQRRYRRKRAFVGVSVGVGLVAVGAFLAEVVPIGSGRTSTEPTVTTLEAPPVTTEAIAAPTTIAEPTAVTTTVPPATTATTEPPPAFIDPIGDPIAISDLQLGANGMGPLEFGDDAADVQGRLAASLGQPTSDTGELIVTDDASGLCPGATARRVGWGSLDVYFEVGDAQITFVSYRVSPFGASDPATGLQTISGLTLGDTVDDLLVIYEGFDVAVGDFPWATGYELRSATDGRLLLWGPVSGPASDGLIEGIYSPLRCEEI